MNIEESKVIVGKPLIVESKPSGSLELEQLDTESKIGPGINNKKSRNSYGR